MALRIPLSRNEGGYLLIATGFAVMALGGIVAALSYTTWREARYQTNYTLGQQFAEAAVVAHNNAQRDFYNAGGGTGFTVPVAFPVFPAQINGIQYTMQAYAVAQAPFVSFVANDQAASAILLLRPVVAATGQEPLAADMTAFADGAASRGMKDIAVFGALLQIDGQSCGADVTAVRWGNPNDPDETKCMTQTDLDNLGIVAQPGDIIVPAWEVAIARMDQRAMMRYPQPGHPEWTQMAADLNMDGRAFTGVGRVETAALNITGDSTMQNTTATATPSLQNVTANSASIIDGASPSEVIVAGTTNVAEPITGPQLTLSGIDAPLQLTVTEVVAPGTTTIVENNVTALNATAANCTVNCPVQ